MPKIHRRPRLTDADRLHHIAAPPPQRGGRKLRRMYDLSIGCTTYGELKRRLLADPLVAMCQPAGFIQWAETRRFLAVVSTN